MEEYKIILENKSEEEVTATSGKEPNIPNNESPDLLIADNKKTVAKAVGFLGVATAQGAQIATSVLSSQGNSQIAGMVQASSSLALKALGIVGGAIVGGPAGLLVSAGTLLSTGMDLGLQAYENSVEREVLNTQQQFNIRRVGYINRGRQ